MLNIDCSIGFSKNANELCVLGTFLLFNTKERIKYLHHKQYKTEYFLLQTLIDLIMAYEKNYIK